MILSCRGKAGRGQGPHCWRRPYRGVLPGQCFGQRGFRPAHCSIRNGDHGSAGVSGDKLPDLFRNISIEYRPVPFPKEPALAPGHVVRGVLKFGDNPSNAIPFVWQTGAKKLFLDPNPNQDLTDDANGVFYGSLTGPRFPTSIIRCSRISTSRFRQRPPALPCWWISISFSTAIPGDRWSTRWHVRSGRARRPWPDMIGRWDWCRTCQASRGL